MTAQTLQCIYIDHEVRCNAIFTKDKQVEDAAINAHPRLQSIIKSLQKSFDTVYVCSTAPEVLQLLNDSTHRSDCYTSVLVSTTIDMLQQRQVKRLGMDAASNYHELDTTAATGIETLSGLALLRHINLVCLSLRTSHVHTAAYAPQLNLELARAIEDAGTQTIIEDIELVRALDHYIMQNTPNTSNSLSIGLTPDTAKYENENVRPSQEQWDGLCFRIQSFNQIPISLRSGIVDLHMPHYQPPILHKSGYFSSQAFLSQVTRLQLMVSSWNFSTLDLSEDDLMGCAMVIFKHVLASPEVQEWQLSDDDLFSFIDAIRRSYYETNPYHNFRHAVDVLQAVFYMLISAEALPKMNADCPSFASFRCGVLRVLMTPQYMLGACIVGIGHDVGHPGVNNAFLISTKAPLALLYNDRSVLENFHCASLSRILTLRWPSTQQPSMRKVIIELILSTDMALHFDYMSRFKEMETICLTHRAAEATAASETAPVELPPATKEKFQVTLFAAMIKCGDISNVARPFPISRGWSHALLREFFNQARLEKSLGLPVTKNFDPEQTAQADSQVFFINLFAHPLFVALQKCLPNLQPISEIISSNRDTWKNNGVPPAQTTQTTSEKPAVEEEPHLAEPLKKSDDSSFFTRNDMTPVDDTMTGDARPRTGYTDRTPRPKKSFCLPSMFRKKRQAPVET